MPKKTLERLLRDRLGRLFHGSPAPVEKSVCSERRCGKGGWRGRFHPRKGVVKAEMHKDMAVPMRRALIGHEEAHDLTVREVCKGDGKDGKDGKASGRDLLKAGRRQHARLTRAGKGGLARFLLGKPPAPARRRRRRRCKYYGQHDAAFYDRLERVHRALGTDQQSALELERMSGYQPPASFGRTLRRRKPRKKKRAAR